MTGFNLPAVLAIYRFEMARTRRTLLQSIISPVISETILSPTNWMNRRIYLPLISAVAGDRLSLTHSQYFTASSLIWMSLVLSGLMTTVVAAVAKPIRPEAMSASTVLSSFRASRSLRPSGNRRLTPSRWIVA